MRAVAIALVLAGCATEPDMVWVGGMNFDADQGACEAQAASATANPYRPYSPAWNQLMAQQVQIYEACMRSRGWRLVAKR